jgi:aspartyl-tRNA(Asn)/glutamyl-tRNA(Gln) amidotransferase subunit A
MIDALDSDPTRWTLIEAVGAIRAGTISSVELTEACLARIDALQPTLNAFIAVHRERALEAAHAADEHLRAGKPCGRLHGVPLAHKDMFQRAGQITAGGSKILAGRISVQTSPLLQRLDDSGGIDLGRLNMAEFAMGPTGHNAHHGRVCNPVRTDLISGGSSSGSGAAVGAGLVFGALGSDTGGSIRLPAALCGIAGLKPTQDRLSMAHVLPLSVSMDCPGPLARSVEDLALLFSVLADPMPEALEETARLEAALAHPPSLHGWRVGIPEAYWGDDLDGDVAAALEASRQTLVALGATCVTVDAPDLDMLCERANFVSMFEAADVHRENLDARPGDYGPQVLARLLNGRGMSKTDHDRALGERAHWREVMLAAFEDCDVIQMPVLAMSPPTAAAVDVNEGPGLHKMIAGLTRYTRPISYLGFPALAQPIGFTPSGLPLSMQLVAPPLAEARLLAIGQAFERARAG